MTDIKKAAAGLRAIEKLFAPLADIKEVIEAAEGAEFAAQAAEKRRADAEARRVEAETAIAAAKEKEREALDYEARAKRRAADIEAKAVSNAEARAQVILANAANDGAALMDAAKAKVAAVEAELAKLEEQREASEEALRQLTADADKTRAAIEAMRESAKALLG